MQAIINSKLILPHTVLTGQTLLLEPISTIFSPAGSPLPEGTESIDAKGPISRLASSICISMAAAGPIQWMGPGPPWKSSAGNFQNAALRHFTDDNDKGMAHRSKGAQKRS